MTGRIAICIVIATMLGPSAAGTAEPARKPNVLFIAVDDLRDWVGYLNRNPQTITPNIDRLAKRGMAFTRSYCAAPVCNPSRAALMSGMRPSTTGVYDNGNDWRKVIPPEQTLNSTFRNAGYFVCGAGKIYHGAYERRADWDDYLTREGGNPLPKGNDGVGGIKFAPLDCKDEDLAEWKITNYAIEQLGKKHDKPFFIACGLHKPHMPWNVPQKYYDMHPLKDIKLPPLMEKDLADIPPAGIQMAKPQGDHKAMLESGRWREAIQGYLAAITYCDAMIGRLMDAFDKCAYRDNTIVVFWCDHGWHLGEKEHWRKFALWEESTRSPLIWCVPGMTKPGSVCERTVDFITIYPTLTDLCGIQTPKHVDGKSIRPLLSDAKASWSEPAVTTYRFKNHTVRTEEWRYIRYANGDEELYNEVKDPNEWTNLAMKPEYADKKKELARLLPAKDAADVGPAEKKKKNKQ